MRGNEGVSERRTLLTPLYPGFGRTPRAEWLMSVRDLAGFIARYVREQRLAPIDVIGFSLGGWIAAEMAANDPALFSKIVLVAPAGIRPPEGEIADMFRVPALTYLKDSVRDPARTPEFPALYDGGTSPEQYEAFEDARGECRHMAAVHVNPSLPICWRGTQTRPLLVWGRDDQIVPISAPRYSARVKIRIAHSGLRPST